MITAWAWQKAGEIDLGAGRHTLALHDLTGFNGRCDAIYMTDDLGFTPPDDTAAIEEMYRQTGPCVIEDGILKRGVLIRHLVLPAQPENTRRCLDWIAERFPNGEVLVSLMSQYTPQAGAEGALGRHVTAAEYRAAAAYMENCGIVNGFVQERTSAREEYTPAFDLTGV